MTVALSQSVTFAIGNEDADGAPVNASSIAATLYRNGASTAETVTVTNLTTGIYSVAFTVPGGYAVGDILQVRVLADGIGRFVWGDAIDVTVTAATSPLATAANQTTILNRLGAWTGTGLNTVLGALRAIAAKAAALTPTDLSSGTTFDNTTDSLEAIRDAGAGGGDATLAKQEEILAAIDNYISTVVAGMELDTTTIVGFPSSLNIGDSYTDDMSADIHIFLRDSNDDPITAVGTHDVTDPDFAPELTIAQDGQVGRVKATVTWVTASPEGYLKVEIPSSQSRRAAPGVAQMQLVLKWDGAEKALTKQAVTWVARV